jgi:hypothetical protein
MIAGITPWQNDNGRSNYPLENNTAVIDNLIVDASFVQFDGYVPTLQSILVSSTDFTVYLLTDAGVIGTTFLLSDYQSGLRHMSVYDNANGYNKRYLGRLVFGDGANNLWNMSVANLFIFNVGFLTSTVRTIPSTSAIYSINGKFGAIEFGRTTSDTAIFYNVDPAEKWIAFNAVENHKLPASSTPVLKLLNLMPPVNNNVFLGSNDVINIVNGAEGSVNIAVAGNNVTPNSSVITSLAS